MLKCRQNLRVFHGAAGEQYFGGVSTLRYLIEPVSITRYPAQSSIDNALLLNTGIHQYAYQVRPVSTVHHSQYFTNIAIINQLHAISSWVYGLHGIPLILVKTSSMPSCKFVFTKEVANMFSALLFCFNITQI